MCSLQGRQGAAQNPPAILALCLGKIGVVWLAGTEVAQIAPILCLGCPGSEMVQRAPRVMIFGPLSVALHEDSESGLQMVLGLPGSEMDPQSSARHDCWSLVCSVARGFRIWPPNGSLSV